jgi:hypothetical protein
MHVLMEDATAAQKCTVIHAHVTAQQTIVRDYNVVSDCAVVSDVRSGHQEIFIADFGGASIGCPAMNRAMFTNNIFVPNLDPRFALGGKRKILGRRADDRAMSDKIAVSNQYFALDYGMRLNGCFLADGDVWADYRIRPNLNPTSDLRLRIDDRSGMNFDVAHHHRLVGAARSNSQHARFFETKVAGSSVSGRTDNDVIKQFDL